MVQMRNRQERSKSTQGIKWWQRWLIRRLDRQHLLERLEEIRYEPQDDRSRDELAKLSLAGSLLQLAQLTPDREFELCRSVTMHLLGRVPEPDIDQEDDL